MPHVSVHVCLQQDTTTGSACKTYKYYTCSLSMPFILECTFHYVEEYTHCLTFVYLYLLTGTVCLQVSVSSVTRNQSNNCSRFPGSCLLGRIDSEDDSATPYPFLLIYPWHPPTFSHDHLLTPDKEWLSYRVHGGSL